MSNLVTNFLVATTMEEGVDAILRIAERSGV